METLFIESLKRLEADMETNTRNPLSLLQLTMRFLSFLSFMCSPNFNIIDTRYAWPSSNMPLLRMVIRLKLTVRQKLTNEVNNNLPKVLPP